MRNWREIFKSLTRSPRGFSADGRTLGLGLATAMEQQRQENQRDIEEFLRRSADDQSVGTSA